MCRYIQTAAALAVLATATFAAQQTHAKRLVIIKVDGVPADLIAKFVDRTDPKTGRSTLPWIKRVFDEKGTTVRNFYVRGISLSAPSWCVLDTGRHSVIHGNAEYDRYGPRVYDYLNMFPFYLGFATSRKEDMPGVEVLDEAGVPMLIDHFKPYQRSQGLQLYQRGVRWSTLQRTMRNRVFRPPQVLLNEWQTGFEVSRGLYEQIELEMIDSLANPDVAYLDIFLPEYDHVAHLTEDEVSQLTTLKHLDAIVGRLWNAIEASALGPDTILVLVSDHGMNTEPGTYAQGYNLVRFFNSVEGGAHHVVTNRYPMQMYKLRGLDPFVSEVITKSDASLYLSGREQSYPTAQLDLDGNERAGIQLRNSDLNELQIALAQARSGSPQAPAAILARAIIDRNRAAWSKAADAMDEELAALHRAVGKLRVAVEAQKTQRKWTPEETRNGLPQAARRLRAMLGSWEQDRRNYTSYLESVRRLLKWAPGDAPPEMPVRAMGDPNTAEQLRNYAVGAAAGGITSEEAASFRRMDCLTALTSIRVRNNVQQNVPARPVDFVAVRSVDAVLLFGDDDHQLLIESAADPARGVLLRVAPVRGASRKPTEWGPGFPLALYEDPNLSVPGDRSVWLSGWHSDREWLNAIYRTRYTNAVVGLYEHFRPWQPRELPEVFRRYASPGDEPVLLRFVARRRALVDNDMLVLASDHWNFNIRNFNAGGNHGAFFPMSTRSVLMLAGGGIPQGRRIEQPYDGLSFVPTLLALMGRLGQDERPLYPGPVIEELFPPSPATDAAQKVVRSAN